MTAGKTRRREQAVAALLTEPTLDRAAHRAGVSEKTLRRWLRDAEFQSAYGAAREEALRMALGRLQGLLLQATATLERAMLCGTPTTEVRAPIAVIEHGFKGTELLDLANRVAALEAKPDEAP